MSVTIYRKGTINTVRATIDVDDTSQQSVAVMGENTLTLDFSVTEGIDFKIGDYCIFFNTLYQINTLPTRTENSKRNLAYKLVMESEMYDLGKVQLLFLDQDNIFKSGKFPFRGKAKDYGDLIIYNMKRRFPNSDWKLGYVIDTPFMEQSFTGNNCLEALKTVADMFGTEYLVEGKTINIFQRNTSSGITLKVGKDEALKTLTEESQDNSNPITRLYAYGSTKNISNTYRNASENLRMGDVDYIEKNEAVYGVFEKTIYFDGSTKDSNGATLPEIFPHRTGTVTSVDDPFNFRDSSMNFNVNSYLISGVSAKVVFNSGLLVGYTFELSAYDNATKKFTLIQNTSQPSLILPSASLLPVIGDTYVIVDIKMPQTYIDAAEAELRSVALDYINKHNTPTLQYSGECNPLYFKRGNIQFKLAQSLNIQSNVLGINVNTRIMAFTRSINSQYSYSLTLADTVKPNSLIVLLINAI